MDATKQQQQQLRCTNRLPGVLPLAACAGSGARAVTEVVLQGTIASIKRTGECTQQHATILHDACAACLTWPVAILQVLEAFQ